MFNSTLGINIYKNMKLKNKHLSLDFNKSPMTIAWEITQACAFKCIHCRAQAQYHRNKKELTTKEGLLLIDQIKKLGALILVITGGDPMVRKDLYTFIRYAKKIGLKVGISPSATNLLNYKSIEKLKESGVDIIHISLDGATDEVHDKFRGFTGSFKKTLEIIKYINKLNIPLQIGTTISKRNVNNLTDIKNVLLKFNIYIWSLFFLVPTGRALTKEMISDYEQESVLEWIFKISQNVKFLIRTTAAQNYRRVFISNITEKMYSSQNKKILYEGKGYSFNLLNDKIHKGVNDGHGFCFIDHIGNVYPSGFLQIPTDNVKNNNIKHIYQNSNLFIKLRSKNLLKGKCGICNFKYVCGGSRARAYSMHSDFLESDFNCAFLPFIKELNYKNIFITNFLF